MRAASDSVQIHKKRKIEDGQSIDNDREEESNELLNDEVEDGLRQDEDEQSDTGNTEVEEIDTLPVIKSLC